MNAKKLLIPVAVILAAAIVLFAASAGLAGTAEAKRAETIDQLLDYMLPGGGSYEYVANEDESSNILGSYVGSQGSVVESVVPGFMTDIHMLVGVQNDGLVTSVCILENNNTYGLGMKASSDWDFLVQLVDSKGDLAVGENVDAITGATISTNAVVNAVNAAQKYAAPAEEPSSGGLTGTAEGFAGPITVEVTMDGDTITGVTVTSNSESAPGTALEDIPAAIVAANSPDVDVVAGATYTSQGIIDAVKNALENAGSAGGSGGLTGTAEGFAGPITVEVTMDGDTITGVTVTSNSESAPGTALEDIPAAIVAANSPDVDVVAGATYTSNGIINAVKDAIGA